MTSDVRNRIQQVLDHKKVTVNSLAVKYGENQSKLSKQIKFTTTISLDTILLLLNEFQDLSAEWLLRGTGEMFIDMESDASSIESRITRLEQQIKQLTNL